MDTTLTGAAADDATRACTTRAGWLVRADKHYATAARRAAAGDRPEVVANEIAFAQLCIARAKQFTH